MANPSDLKSKQDFLVQLEEASVRSECTEEQFFEYIIPAISEHALSTSSLASLLGTNPQVLLRWGRRESPPQHSHLRSLVLQLAVRVLRAQIYAEEKGITFIEISPLPKSAAWT